MTQKSPLFQPWGLIAGLLTAAVVTLVGVVCQIDPATILFRATVAAFGVGITVGFIVMIAQIAAKHDA